MNISVDHIDHAKAAAARLRDRLSHLGAALTHTQALEAVAAVGGGTDWNRYRAQLARTAPRRRSGTLVPFVYALPGEGGWLGLRLHDRLQLEEHPTKTSIWCMPDHLDSQALTNPEGLQVLRTTEELEALTAGEWAQLAHTVAGKILFVCPGHPQGTPAACLAAVGRTRAVLAGSPVEHQALGVTFADAQRWLVAGGAQAFLRRQAETLACPVRFESCMIEDLEVVGGVWAAHVLPASCRTQVRALDVLSQGLPAHQQATRVDVLAPQAQFDGAALDTLEGCVAFARLRMDTASRLRRSNPVFTDSSGQGLLRTVEAFLAEDTRQHLAVVGDRRRA